MGELDRSSEGALGSCFRAGVGGWMMSEDCRLGRGLPETDGISRDRSIVMVGGIEKRMEKGKRV